MYGPGRCTTIYSSQSDNGEFVPTAPGDPIRQLEGQLGSTCLVNEGGVGDSVVIGAGGEETLASLDPLVLSDFTGDFTSSDASIFDDNDDSFSSFMLSDPNNNANVALDTNYDLAFVSNDFGEGQDFSLFDAKA